ncbi:hypothetical protein DB347_24840 [Opitutaceae bacterium EW11]|nr:hypothetical protein DB347_24840 [Opitutaceae bacterium EW11]
MSAIDEGIVREYFEQNGFLVRQVRKYEVQARKKTGDEEIDLLVYNPSYQRGQRKPDFFLYSAELPFIHRAILSVKPWHTGRFTPGTLKSSPEIFSFLEENVLREATRFFPVDTEVEAAAGESAPGELTKILVLPSLPTAEPFRSQSVEMLKQRGVDAIISFRAMLLDIIDQIEPNRNYGKSDTLQVMRILKNYDLLKDAQLEMFADRGGLKRGKGAGGGEP